MHSIFSVLLYHYGNAYFKFNGRVNNNAFCIRIHTHKEDGQISLQENNLKRIFFVFIFLLLCKFQVTLKTKGFQKNTSHT